MRRKFLSVVLCVCMMLTMAPFAFAEGESIGAQESVVAKIGDQEYSTLQAAINAATTGQTIQLVADTTDATSNSYIIQDGKELNLDLNGKHLTLPEIISEYFIIKNGKLTITDTSTEGNGEIIATKCDNLIDIQGSNTSFNFEKGIIVLNGYWSYENIKYGNTAVLIRLDTESTDATGTPSVNFGKDAKIVIANKSGDDTIYPGWAIMVNGIAREKAAHYGATVDVYGQIINGGLYVNGTVVATQNTVPVFNVYDGAKIDGQIYAAGYAKWNISGGDIKADTGMEIRAGELNMTGGSLVGTATPTSVKPNGNGGTSDGVGLAIAQHTTRLPISVNISSGTISGFTGLLESNPQNGSSADIEKINVSISGGNFTASNGGTNAAFSEDNRLTITGGTFSSDVTNYVAENYTCIQNNDKYTVKALNEVAVAKIGDILYPTLAKAIEAVPDNGESATTVTLIKDSTEDVTIPANKKVALELNGKKLTNVSSNTITNNGTLTITGEGTVDNVTHAKAAIYNKGTVTLNGGTYDRSNEDGVDADNAGTNTYYTILNHGNMTVDSSVTVRNKGHHSSLFENGYYSQNSKDGIDNPTLTITSGTYEGGLNTIKNDDDATLTINGGTFTNYTQAAFQNHGTATVTAGSFIANSKYAIDNCGCDATHDPGKLEISGGTFNGTLYIRSAYSNVTISDGYFNGSISKTGGTLTITGGYFTSDPSAYVAEGKATLTGTDGYRFMVGNKVTTNVVPTTTTPKTDVSNTIPNEQKEAVQNAAASVKDNGELAAAANTVATEVTTTAAEGQQLLNNASITATAENTKIYVQTYLDIKADNVEVGTDGKITSITLDITPMSRVVASTATTAEDIALNATTSTPKNAVILPGSEKELTNIQTMVISFELPTNFVTKKDDGTYPPIYVQHKGHEYTATVTESDGKLIATFTNPDGFSPFTISRTSTAVATIGDNKYTSLQAAVDAVKDGETINVTGTGLSATVSGSKTFKVTGQTVNLTAASGYNLTNSGTTYTVSHQSSGGPGSSGGSISTPTTYAVNVNAATNGAVAADKKTASKGTTVTVTASPSKGYVVDAVKVVDKDGKDVAVTGKDGKYVFTMPASAVTVTGSFKAETPAPATLPFTDVKSGNWFYDAVKYAYAQGLMTGTSATTFAPNGTMNRAMIVTVLYRLEKSPAVTGASKFTDVPAGQWYSDAVAWAAANKIVNGYDETTFGPMNAVTREQMAAILFRYEQVKGLENVTLEENLNRFPDQNKISAYAIPALQWAVGQKIINGNADGTLDPTGTATRAQVAQIFTNLLNQ